MQTHELATSLGLRVVTPDEIGHLDLAIDGADEVDPSFNLTKGGGAAHTREKIVAAMADRFVVVVDESKLVPALGPFGTPLEVLDFAPGVVTAAVRALGATEVTTRARRSDNGNLIMDAQFGTIADPGALAAELAAMPGIVEHGIFPGDDGRARRGRRRDRRARTGQRPLTVSSSTRRLAAQRQGDPTGSPSTDVRAQRARYWARAPTASLLRRFERCRPSSTNSTALATTAGDSSPPVKASTGWRSVGSSPRRST